MLSFFIWFVLHTAHQFGCSSHDSFDVFHEVWWTGLNCIFKVGSHILCFTHPSKSRYIQLFKISAYHPHYHHGFGCCLFTLNCRFQVICYVYSKDLFKVRLTESHSTATRSLFIVDVQSQDHLPTYRWTDKRSKRWTSSNTWAPHKPKTEHQ